MHFLFNLLCVLQFLIGFVLIVVVTMQESKSDGLTGQIGTTTTSSFKGKAGREDRLNELTKNTAIVFFIVSILVAVGAQRW